MSNGIRISVVLASYNGASFIELQLRSLLAALAENDEIIVSDDNSADTTRQIVSTIQDSRVRLLSGGPRLGYQQNFARAIGAARGQFIFFSDQDDVCLPARIGESLEALQRKACVCGDATVVDADLHVTAPSFFALRKATRFTAWQLFVRPAVIGATMACTRSFVEQALPFPNSVPHDHWLSVLAAAQGRLEVVRRPFILYRRHAGVASSTGAKSRRPLWKIISERLKLAFAVLNHAFRQSMKTSGKAV